MDKIKSALDAYIPFLIGLALLHFVWKHEVTFQLVVMCVLGNLSYLAIKALIIRNNRDAAERARR